jgi:hypothetical protein
MELLSPDGSLGVRQAVRFSQVKMRKVSEYEAHADECRMLAAQMKNPQHKMQLEQMAAAWDMLAEARKKQLAWTLSKTE